MKKLLATLITAILLVSTCIIAAFPTQAEDINWDDWIFDGQGELVAYYGTDSEVVIPSEDQDGIPTVTIAEKAFINNTDITKVVIPEGIVKIARSCFESCTNLEEVSLPYSLTEVKGQIFRNTNIHSIVIPPVQRIEGDFLVTSGDARCTDVIITPGVQSIGTGAFYAHFTEIIIPKSVVEIDWGFYMTRLAATDEVSVYILNPTAEVGKVVEGQDAGLGTSRLAEEVKSYDYKTEGAPIVYSNGRTNHPVKVYGAKGSTAETHTNRFKTLFNGSFYEMSESQIEEKEAYCAQNGIQKPAEKPVDSTSSATDSDEDSDTSSSDKGSTSNKDKDKVNTDTTDNSGVIIIIAAVFGGLFLLVIIAIVVAIVILNNKKKNKKAKKAAKAVIEPENAPVEEAPTDTEE